MHARSRIILCRIGLILFCIVPTAATLAWIATAKSWNGRQASKAEWEHELSARLGLAIEIANLRYPSPTIAELKDVRLLDPETRELIATAAFAEVSPAAAGWDIHLSSATLNSTQLTTLLQAMESRVLRDGALATGSNTLSIRCRSSAFVVHDVGRDVTFDSLFASISFADKSATLALEFRPAGTDNSARPFRANIHRDSATKPATTMRSLDTGGPSVDCQLLSRVWPAVNRLGADCKFCGTIQATEATAGASGSLIGIFQDVDLSSLVSDQFGHQLSGSATVQIAQAVIKDDKLVELQGKIEAQNGAISPSFIAALHEHLELKTVSDQFQSSRTGLIPFQSLSVNFHLTGQSLSLAPENDGAGQGILLAGSNGPIILAPPQHSVPAVNLLRALLPDNQFQVPATRQTASLISLLPVPDFVPGTTGNLPSHTPTRLSAQPPGSPAPIRQPRVR